MIMLSIFWIVLIGLIIAAVVKIHLDLRRAKIKFAEGCEWSIVPRDRYLTVYFPGHGADLSQAARYTPCLRNRRGDVIAYHPDAMPLFGDIYTGEADDASDAQPHERRPFFENGMEWINRLFDIPYRVLVFLLSGVRSSIAHGWLHITRNNIAQASDTAMALAITRNGIDRAVASKRKVILFGTSRGSVVALNVFVSLTPQERQHVDLVVLEGTFLDSGPVIDYRFGSLGAPLVKTFLKYFTQWKPDGHRPYHALITDGEVFKDNAAEILIITSLTDTVVPARFANDLHRLIQSSMTPETATSRLHILTLQASGHSKYVLDNEDDRAAYVKAISPLVGRAKKIN